MTATTLAKPLAQQKAFPQTQIEAALKQELLVYVGALAPLKGIALPAQPDARVKISFRIDSLGVVDLLCSVEPLLGFELKESVVRTGGYSSIQDALDHLMPRIEKAWTKKYQ